MYSGPIIDAFLHGPWIGIEKGSDVRADRVEWTSDKRLQRVMRTFKHSDPQVFSRPISANSRCWRQWISPASDPESLR